LRGRAQTQDGAFRRIIRHYGVGLFMVRLLLAAVCLWQAAGTAVLKSRRVPTVGRRRADRPDEWARCPSAGDMKYGVDLILVEARNQPTRVLSGEGGDVYAATTSLLDDLGHDR
jgi:hypothetical protein